MMVLVPTTVQREWRTWNLVYKLAIVRWVECFWSAIPLKEGILLIRKI
jgi:hypothetical protein